MDGQLIALITTVGGGLSAAVVVLWRIVLRRAEDCEKKHEQTSKELLEVSKEVGELKGRVSLAEELTPRLNAIEEVSQAVLKNLNKKPDD